MSSSYQAGMKLLRAGTRAFIMDDPIFVVLIPNKGTRIEKPSGGYDYEPATARPLQTFKYVNQSGDSSAIGDSESGLPPVSRSGVLIGEYDAVAEPGDSWVDGGNRYVIQELLSENGYERKWLVNSHGLEPNYG